MSFLRDRDKATIEKGNILSDGYGLSPQLVARDSWLTTGARALYFYLSSFAGASGTCYPSRDIMTHELGINKDTFSKYLNELKTSGYIKVYKNKTREGRMQNNIYEIVFDRSYIEGHISIRCKKENKKKPCPKKADMEPCPNLPDMAQPDMEKSDTISNSIINNSIKSSMYIEQPVDNYLKEFKKLYEENIGVVYPVTAEWLLEVSNEVDIKVFKRAIEICAERMSMNLSYLKGILKKWKDANITTYEQLELYKLQHENKKSRKSSNQTNKNKFANFEQTFTQYSNKELDEIIKKSQKAKFK
ncbi:DnaD domain protein [Clostridioides difficile]|uniref:DnaD domain protein n=1 Tax=unclassified Clostridioides TaxID=2635829 RepID=UPI001D0C6DD6|nr:DnaD domain protein [Clostridioides difficile]MDS6221870.1 DnaD domain protein [Clostridioides difficile]